GTVCPLYPGSTPAVPTAGGRRSAIPGSSRRTPCRTSDPPKPESGVVHPKENPQPTRRRRPTGSAHSREALSIGIRRYVFPYHHVLARRRSAADVADIA